MLERGDMKRLLVLVAVLMPVSAVRAADGQPRVKVLEIMRNHTILDPGSKVLRGDELRAYLSQMQTDFERSTRPRLTYKTAKDVAKVSAVHAL
jgi:hypothetical protein